MADYVKIQNVNGELGISRDVFESIAHNVTLRVGGNNASVSKSRLYKLFKPISVTFRKDGKVDVLITIVLKKGGNATEVCKNIQSEVANALLAYTESITFNIGIKIESIC